MIIEQSEYPIVASKKLLICEREQALNGIKCVLRIFLINMAAHTDG